MWPKIREVALYIFMVVVKVPVLFTMDHFLKSPNSVTLDLTSSFVYLCTFMLSILRTGKIDVRLSLAYSSGLLLNIIGEYISMSVRINAKRYLCYIGTIIT